ncbi:UDP-N-acetylglucosamine transferase subunit ALG13 [Bacillus sp. SORGH_AS 510]|uniref:glycosyltransferase n=1 Tax=Bacillus sp. SORGH_AS_0510 TaxID=3041771 RepID=UPI0027822B64|nr:glycosyltransferase [Bacillus sp. SORGH_AS_0510]MDQ1143760.1 UDP-N-acetylglucosamine transferase subunit ALG13 [Bacillus sp. SORGH_AS_0510]
MIFVTVGTHEQPFNRLVEFIDQLKARGAIQEDVIMQTGFSAYEPKYCQWGKLYPYQEMVKHVSEARIVITHGGPSSFIMPLQAGKVPIVVPRQKKYHEHVNNHQVDFSKAVAERQGNIIVAEEMEQLELSILNYDAIVQAMPAGLKSNNEKFNMEFSVLVDELFKERKK